MTGGEAQRAPTQAKGPPLAEGSPRKTRASARPWLPIGALALLVACGDGGGAAGADAGRPKDAARRHDASELQDASPTGAGGPSPDEAPRDASLSDAGGFDGGEGTDASVGTSIPFPRRVIYLAMPDRFDNGDASNDRAGLDCHDPGSPTASHGGDLDGLVARLGYLEDLGVDLLWTTPLYRQARGRPDRPCPYHGYWADFALPDDGAVEPRLGGAPALERLREALAVRGMGYVLDVVVNHAGDEARIVQQRPTWFHDPRTCAAGDPLLDCGFRPGSPDFDQDRPEVATYLSEVHRDWLRRSGAEALRMDTAKHVPRAYFRDEFLPAMRDERPELVAFAEVFTDDWDLLEAYVDAGFDGALLFPVATQLRAAMGEGASLDGAADAVAEGLRRLGPAMQRSVLFVDNHDMARFTNLPGFGVDPEHIAERLRTAMVALLTLPAVPQIYQGDELGLYGGDDPDNRRDMPAWAWEATTRDDAPSSAAAGDPAATFALVAEFARLRRRTPALWRGAYAELWRPNGGANAWVYARHDDDELLIVALNASDAEIEVEVPLAPSALPEVWEARVIEAVLEGIRGPEAAVRDGGLILRIPARGFRILRVPGE